jgi:hypothetical protein
MIAPYWRGTFERDKVTSALQFKVYVDSLGNPFSDEKSACLQIKQSVNDNYALGDIVIKIEGPNGFTMCAYVADMS